MSFSVKSRERACGDDVHVHVSLSSVRSKWARFGALARSLTLRKPVFDPVQHLHDPSEPISPLEIWESARREDESACAPPQQVSEPPERDATVIGWNSAV